MSGHHCNHFIFARLPNSPNVLGIPLIGTKCSHLLSLTARTWSAALPFLTPKLYGSLNFCTVLPPTVSLNNTSPGRASRPRILKPIFSHLVSGSRATSLSTSTAVFAGEGASWTW